MVSSMVPSLAMRWIVAHTLVLVACGGAPAPAEHAEPVACAPCPTCPTEASAPAAEEPPGSGSGETIRLGPSCSMSDTRLLLQVRIDTAFTYKGEPADGPRAGSQPIWWQLFCELSTGECTGARIHVPSAGEPLEALDWGTMSEARIVDRRPGSLTIRWGPYRTFTFDSTARTVAYAESSPDAEGHGTGACEAQTTPP
jgi:hypothetical protein